MANRHSTTLPSISLLALSLSIAWPVGDLTAQAPRTPAKPPATTRAPSKAAPPVPAPPRGEPWLTWGGPRKDFTVATSGLATSWPAGGPPRIWSRALGDGYSAIAEENGILYTGYRRGDNDVVVALDAASGKTLWESPHPSPFTSAYSAVAGPGPYTMPQIVGNRLVAASGIGHIRSLDKQTGKPVWAHDLYGEYSATRLIFGYSSHALPYKDTLIVLGGGGGIWARLTGFGASGVLAFNQRDGAVAWQGLTFENAHSSPLLISVDGQPQVVALLAQEVIAFNPDNGAELWRHPHPTGNGLAISTPLWGPENVLIVSSAYGGGTRALQLRQADGQTVVRELWHNPRVQAHFGALIRIGDHLVVSSGHSGPAFVTAVNMKTGAIAWQQRGFAKAQMLHADGKLVVLDEDGTLALATATPQRFDVLAQAPLLKKTAWTPPTLVGTRLYVRDRATIMALDLGAPVPASR